LIPNSPGPLLYLITDRRVLSPKKSKTDLAPLFDFVSRALEAGVDMVQVRERDLPAKHLAEFVESLVCLARGCNARVLVNDRADIAACCGAGVHLTTRSMGPDIVRKTFGPDLLIGVSTHSMEEAVAAEEGEADFIVFGPVFETASKKIYGPPVGLELLEEVAGRLRIPVLALGGIDVTNFRLPLERGATGVAAISLFAAAEDLRAVVKHIKSAG
jgi:thiamine-phosphate pyrophosphorylase